MNEIKIDWPERKYVCTKIIPVFIPFLGCPKKCVFCSQELQTGTKQNSLTNLKKNLQDIQDHLTRKENNNAAEYELGFYGGTFTNASDDIWQICLEMAKKAKDARLITGFRCSTRPDSLDSKRLAELKESGCNSIELGIQSFSDKALHISERGYNKQTAIDACKKIKRSTFKLGIQLMPGMPGSEPGDFLADLNLSLNFQPAFLRFYPCLVIRGTKLQNMWQNGKFAPWNMKKALNIIAKAWLISSFLNTNVIRMGVAYEKGLESAILAGPYHSCFGSRVMGYALLMLVSRHMRKHKQKKVAVMYLPEHAKGYYYGWQNELEKHWKRLGISKKNIHWHYANKIEIQFQK